MLLPVLLLFVAIASAAVVAYGTHYAWAAYPHGVQFILAVRQYQWPLAALCLIACVALIALVVSGKRRLWWLVGLAPVLALFVHHFWRDPIRAFSVLDNPGFVPAAEAKSVADDDYVVGLSFAGKNYAYPFKQIYAAPVIFQTDQTKRMILLWSAYANRAIAYHISLELRPEDVEIVSMPANALMIYNSKLGEFINGVTGQTSKQTKPTGFLTPIAPQKMTWKQWRVLHADTLVLGFPTKPPLDKINAPLRAALPQPRVRGDVGEDTRIVVITTTQPTVAMPTRGITYEPLNFKIGPMPMLMFVDPESGRILAYERRIDDLVPRFKRNTNRNKPGYLVDSDTNTTWSTDGRAVKGPMADEHKRLKPVPVDEGLYWGVMRLWVPKLEWLDPAEFR